MAESAVKLWIRDIVQGTYEAAESGYGGSITTPSGVKSSRVRILGTIVEKFVAENRSFASATIDDSTETINIKVFKDRVSEIEDREVGDIVDVLGEINEYEGELNILSKALQKVDINHELLRRVELNSTKPIATTPEKQAENLEKLIFKKLKELDKGDGVNLDELIKDLKDLDENLVVSAVQNLMHKGDVFEPKKNLLKLV
jgi:RPA family protein